MESRYERRSTVKDKVEVTPIWEESISPGLRFQLLFDGKFPLQIDVSTGDPLFADPEIFHAPFLIKHARVEIMAAWKLHALFEHINGPWQSKTLLDLLFARSINVRLLSL